MSEEANPTFGLQAGGATPPAEASVSEVSLVPEGESQGEMTDARTYAEKYNSVEELEKGYLELQQKFSEARPSTSEMTIEGVLDAAGLKPDEVITNYTTEGKLSDHQYESLKNFGFSRQVIDEYLAGRKAIADNSEYAVETMRRQAEELAGGSEQLDNLFDWAGQKYANNEAHLDRINERLQNPQEFQSVIKELLFDWRTETGRGSMTQLIQGDRMPETSSGFTNVGDLLAAMNKVRESGHMDEATRRRIANTPPSILSGVDQ